MAQEIITLQDLQAFRVQLLNDLKQLLADQGRTNPNKEWLRSSDVKKLLKISHGTLQNLRINLSVSENFNLSRKKNRFVRYLTPNC